MKFHLDEHVPVAVAAGLRRRRIDVTTTLDAGLLGALDVAHIEFARRDGRVILTSDPDFIALHAAGAGHAGIVYYHQTGRTIGQMIEFLLLVDACMTQEEMRNHLEFM